MVSFFCNTYFLDHKSIRFFNIQGAVFYKLRNDGQMIFVSLLSLEIYIELLLQIHSNIENGFRKFFMMISFTEMKILIDS